MNRSVDVLTKSICLSALQGVTSTCPYVSEKHPKRAAMNGTPASGESNHHENPFASPAVPPGENGGASNGGAFDSPSGGGAVFGDAADPFAAAAAATKAAAGLNSSSENVTVEQFKQVRKSVQ